MTLPGKIYTISTKIPFLMKQIKNTKNKISKTCKADNTWLYEELGIYNSDPEKDKKINDELKSFLKTIGIKLARINKKNKLQF